MGRRVRWSKGKEEKKEGLAKHPCRRGGRVSSPQPFLNSNG